MDRVHGTVDRPLDEMRQVAIAVGTVSEEQRQIGVLHRDAGTDGIRMLHLEWHHRLANSSPNQAFLWVDPAIHPKRLAQVAAVCRSVWRSNRRGSIPYGFSIPSDCFDAVTCKFLIGPTRHGLTCATFVLALFDRAGLPLVQYDTWPVGRPGDADWQQKMVSLLERTGALPAHVDAVREEIGSVRFRPEEVAGAATEPTLPVKFQLATARAEQILERLD